MNIKNFKLNKRCLALFLSVITLLPGCNKKQTTANNSSEKYENIIDDFNIELTSDMVSSNAETYLSAIDAIEMKESQQKIIFSSENVNLDALSVLPFNFMSNDLLVKIDENELIGKKYDINTVERYFSLYKSAIKNIVYSIELENMDLEEAVTLYESLLRKIYNIDIQIFCEYELETNENCELLNNIFQVKDIYNQYLLDKFYDAIDNPNDTLNMNDIINSILNKFPLLKIEDVNSIDSFTVNYQIIKLKELLHSKTTTDFTYTLKKY